MSILAMQESMQQPQPTQEGIPNCSTNLLLVVISITDTIRAFRACVLFPCNPGKIPEKTGVPTSYTLPTFSRQIGFVVDIEAGASWADHAASTTSEKGIPKIFPGWTVLFKA